MGKITMRTVPGLPSSSEVQDGLYSRINERLEAADRLGISAKASRKHDGLKHQ